MTLDSKCKGKRFDIIFASRCVVAQSVIGIIWSLQSANLVEISELPRKRRGRAVFGCEEGFLEKILRLRVIEDFILFYF